MAIGPGKYDDLCTAIRESTNAECVILVVVGGNLGHGFSVQLLNSSTMIQIPNVLREVATQIERDLRSVTNGT
jgi:hypothetical protein